MGYYRNALSDIDQGAEVKLLGIGEEFIGRWRRIMSQFHDLWVRYHWFQLIGSLLFTVVSVIAIYVALAHTIGKIVDQRLTIGDLAIFAGAAAQLRLLVARCAELVASLRWQVLYAGRLRDFLAIEPPQNRRGTRRLSQLQGRVEFCDVSFRYPGADELTLRNVTFSLEPGETVALVGENGSGKTTIAKLIAGFYQPESGAILFDGRDVAELNPKDLESQIACVFQHFGRYQASAADNIALGNWERLAGDRDAIESVGRRAQVSRPNLPNARGVRHVTRSTIRFVSTVSRTVAATGDCETARP